MSRSRVLVFDWDGTLVNTLEIKIHNAGALFAESFGINPGSVEAAYRQHSGLPRRQLFQAIIAELGMPALPEETFLALSRSFSEKNQAAFTRSNREQLLSQDTLLTLEALYSTGNPLFVSSAADQQEVRQLAAALQLDHFFVEILGSEPGFSKGSEHLNYIIKKCNSSPSQIVFIGDEPTDIFLGRQASVLTIAKAGTYPADRLVEEGADFVITSLGELIPWLDQEKIAEG